jgi:ArsR family transcriptional regulator, virulence genes transcriptional regulator
MNIKSTPAQAALQTAAAEASSLLGRLAHPQRLMLVCQLLAGECAVGALAQAVGLRQPTTSQHLAQLKADGIVVPRRAGQIIYYKLAPGPSRAIIKALQAHFCKEKS